MQAAGTAAEVRDIRKMSTDSQAHKAGSIVNPIICRQTADTPQGIYAESIRIY